MLIKLKSGGTLAVGKATEPKYKEVGDKETPMCEFGVAAERVTDDMGAERTIWVNCKAWRDRAKLAQSIVHKGDTVLVLGKTRNRTWNGNDGMQKSREETEVEFIIPEPQLYDMQHDTLDALMQRPGVTVADPVGAAFAEVDDEDGEFPF